MNKNYRNAIMAGVVASLAFMVLACGVIALAVIG